MTAEFRVDVTTARSPSGDDANAYVDLRVYDRLSNELLAGVQVPVTVWWLLITGGSTVVSGRRSSNLDRVGKLMINERVNLPHALDGDTDRDVARDVAKAVAEQLPEDWRQFDSFDPPRISGGGGRQRYTIVRRWVTA